MAKHRKRRTRYNGKYIGKHRAIVPESYTGRRLAVVLPLTLSMALYPTLVGNDVGFFSAVKGAVPFLDAGEAAAGEVIPDPIVVDPPVDDLPSPTS